MSLSHYQDLLIVSDIQSIAICENFINILFWDNFERLMAKNGVKHKVQSSL
ncbi:hypothetical protein A6M57_13660 [Staphylococcus pseudintermedius]|nr:hypothetical protein A6M57_13660 [Staphylococcus pseudintermedius]